MESFSEVQRSVGLLGSAKYLLHLSCYGVRVFLSALSILEFRAGDYAFVKHRVFFPDLLSERSVERYDIFRAVLVLLEVSSVYVDVAVLFLEPFY